ncbi:hypothetical protein SCHPADRAFT_893577 [Schizopora paradoxa]|uniref:Uncharacterized protein n=1 Tax=Schizopora paradoxa TaxID=27342 RepID=A0A0H2RAC7_9AGAM|nr:hypothetical protein SCHPADRAFT_893577 [Schizopora paradoxa]
MDAPWDGMDREMGGRGHEGEVVTQRASSLNPSIFSSTVWIVASNVGRGVGAGRSLQRLVVESLHAPCLPRPRSITPLRRLSPSMPLCRRRCNPRSPQEYDGIAWHSRFGAGVLFVYSRSVPWLCEDVDTTYQQSASASEAMALDLAQDGTPVFAGHLPHADGTFRTRANCNTTYIAPPTAVHAVSI